MTQKITVLSVVLLLQIGCTVQYAERTAKTCVFAYVKSLDGGTVDNIARHYDLVVLPDMQRWAVPILRKKAIQWRGKPPLLLVYKDCMTVIGPVASWQLPDSTRGGGSSVGGFWHFDSLFNGYVANKADTVFLMKSEKTAHYDTLGRVQAGSGSSYRYRWAMDRGNDYWATFYACSSKVQCLRNYTTMLYDDTYFDGVFIDNVLHDNRDYSIYAQQYSISGNSSIDDSLFRLGMHSFLKRVYEEYHRVSTPVEKPRQILAVGNNNLAYEEDGLWESNLEYLDGGMEESFAQTWKEKQDFGNWQTMVSEIQYAEAQGKICLMHTRVDTFISSSLHPLSVSSFDTTQMMFAFSSYLMGYDSTSYFSFQGDYQHMFYAPVMDIDIGKPQDPYILRDDSVAHRYFEHALVYVNPTELPKSVTIAIGDYYLLKPSGDTLSVENFLIPPYSGVIFKKRK